MELILDTETTKIDIGSVVANSKGDKYMVIFDYLDSYCFKLLDLKDKTISDVLSYCDINGILSDGFKVIGKVL